MANTLKFGNGQWATGNGTALAYNDENANFKPLPFDFTRASSGTTVNQSGLIETVGSGIPRIDFQGNTKGALLLEPQRSNYILKSDDVLSTYQSQNGNVSNASESIDGFNNSIQIEYDASNSLVYKRDFTPTIGTEYTISCFVQMNDNSAPIQTVDANSGDFCLINNNTVVSASDIKTERLTSTNVYRVSATKTASDTNNRFGIIKYSTQSSKGFKVTGFQLEQGSYATSYIPTSGSAVTRVADNPFQREDLASKNLIGNTEFTWFYDCILFYKESGTSVAPRLGSSSNSQIFVGINIPSTGSTDLRIRHKDGTTASNTSSVPFTNGGRFKIAVKISGTTGSAYINGTNLGTFTTAAAINYDKYSNAINNPNNIIDMRIYNTALTDAELVALTT